MEKISALWVGVGLLCVATTIKLVSNSISARTTPSTLTAVQEQPIRVGNRTKSVEVVSTGQRDGMFQVVIRNISSKDIDGYTIALGNGNQTTKTLLNRVLAPSELDETDLPLSAAMTYPPEILAVVFTDDTTEGEPNAAKTLEDMRLGERIQRQNILAFIKQASSAPDATAIETTTKLKTKIKSLPDIPEQGIPAGATHGLRNIKSLVIDDIDGLEQRERKKPHLSSQELLDKLQKDIERKLDQK